MFSEQFDTIVTLGHGGLDRHNQIDQESLQRVDTAINLYEQDVARTITMSGFKSFMNLSKKEVLPEAIVMKDTAVELGVPEWSILTETQARDTIGNAYFVKKNILEPHDWGDIVVVTSPSHIQRSKRIFDHVLGKDYKVTMAAADEAPRNAQKMYEFIGNQLERQVLKGVNVGDDAEVYARLQALIPGYADTHIPQLFMNHLKRFSSNRTDSSVL